MNTTMRKNYAIQLLSNTLQESRDHVDRYWDLVIACRTKYKPGAADYARKKEMEHLESAAYYEDRARDCEKTLQEISQVHQMHRDLAQTKSPEIDKGN